MSAIAWPQTPPRFPHKYSILVAPLFRVYISGGKADTPTCFQTVHMLRKDSCSRLCAAVFSNENPFSLLISFHEIPTDYTIPASCMLEKISLFCRHVIPDRSTWDVRSGLYKVSSSVDFTWLRFLDI